MNAIRCHNAQDVKLAHATIELHQRVERCQELWRQIEDLHRIYDIAVVARDLAVTRHDQLITEGGET